ncbi:MAG: site-specific integrase [Bacteroidales bacterium]|jgi:integrase|nr:site-specific integrase [Bacteroidales bacterium]
MSITQQQKIFATQDYLPAELHELKTWRIVYYAMNPAIGKLARKSIKCNRIKNLSLRRTYAKKLCAEINVKLASGWNPFLEQECSKSFTKLIDALHTFKAEKNKELREDSTRCYNSYVKAFEKWLVKRNESNILCLSFSKQHALDLLSDIFLKQGVSNRTYNNYLTFFRTLFNWMIEREYCKVNHFTKLSKKKTEEKRRDVIPESIRKNLENHLRANDHPFLCISLLCYGCLIRPKEILNLKPGDFLMKERIIRIPANVAKNGKSRDVAMPDYIAMEVLSLGLDKIPADYYVFSDKFRPGKIKKNTRDIGRYWQHLRTELNIPSNISFYSLKDSGITDLLNAGVPTKVVQHHADHSSIAMTEKYDHKNFDLYKNAIAQIPIRFTQTQG